MEPIQLSKPSITDAEVEAAERVLRSGWLVNGNQARAFEDELAAACGKRYAAVVSSGTAALHLALRCMLREHRDHRGAPRFANQQTTQRLLVPAFTFPATANVAYMEGLPVCLGDVAADSFCLPEQTLRGFIEGGHGLAMVVHQFGYPAPLPVDMPQQLVISDAACAIFVKEALAGRCACLSFHPRKLLTTGEGGAVLSDDQGLIEEVRAMRNHGLVARPGSEMLDTVEPGLNYRLPEVAAAVGRVQLRRLPELIAAQREHALHYRARLAGGLRMQADHPGRIWQTVAVALPLGTDRAALRGALREEGIETQVASYGLHRLTAYKDAPVWSGEALVHPGSSGWSEEHHLPVASMLNDCGLALPLWAHMSAEQVDRVCDRLLHALRL